jgi:cellulose synthase/poly-beta-1,6-N-acetylglucosamine synthase-like glycosyltransferase
MNLEIMLANSWVVGITTGLVVYLITDSIKRITEKKEYLKRLTLVNNELLNTLKALIPEKNLPENYILISLHNATAIKYEVKRKDIDSLEIILDKLIKEIMDSSFLKYKDKIEYCTEISKAKIEAIVTLEVNFNKTETLEKAEEKYNKATIRHYRRSAFVIIVPLITILFTIFTRLYTAETVFEYSYLSQIAIMLIFSFLGLFASSKLKNSYLKRAS